MSRRFVAAIVFTLSICLPVAQTAHRSAPLAAAHSISAAKSSTPNPAVLLAEGRVRHHGTVQTGLDLGLPQAAAGRATPPARAGQALGGVLRRSSHADAHPVRGPPSATLPDPNDSAHAASST